MSNMSFTRYQILGIRTCLCERHKFMWLCSIKVLVFEQIDAISSYVSETIVLCKHIIMSPLLLFRISFFYIYFLYMTRITLQLIYRLNGNI